MFQSFMFKEPSPITTTISMVAFVFVAFFGISEIFGKHLQFSKFVNFSSNSNSHSNNFLQSKLSSRIGMFIVYAPPCVVGFASFVMYPNGETRFIMLKSAVTIHFLKRVLEVLFVHKYSGGMVLRSALIISSSYITLVAVLIHLQHLIQEYTEPKIDLKYIGLTIFLVGICGNFYHHYLLSKLRDKKEKGYKIPQGGLFSMVICPHYFFEILDFLGISFISQISLSFSCVVGSTLYMMGRSYVTRKWYISKFKNFPNNVKALIPFVF
ncbi:steroid 5-alpha-reductase DET2-like [Capsicum galapagoense]